MPLRSLHCQPLRMPRKKSRRCGPSRLAPPFPAPSTNATGRQRGVLGCVGHSSMLVIAGAMAWRRRRTSPGKRQARAEVLRDNALPDARAALARAVSSGGDSRIVATEALLSYLSARLETQVSGMTREALISQAASGRSGIV